jgi:transposase
MRRKFSEEFKSEAIKLVLEGGVPISRAASDLGIGESTLSRWLNGKRAETPEPLALSEREELKQLRKENATLRMERDILKKATAYFAKVSG